MLLLGCNGSLEDVEAVPTHLTKVTSQSDSVSQTASNIPHMLIQPKNMVRQFSLSPPKDECKSVIFKTITMIKNILTNTALPFNL